MNKLKALNPEQLREIYETIEAHISTARMAVNRNAYIRDALILRLLFYCGMRANEACKIKMQDFKLNRGLNTGGWIFITGDKNGNTQKYNIAPDLRYYFERWLAVKPASDYLFPSPRNPAKHITRQQLDLAIKQYCGFTSIPDDLRHAHAFRHACGQALTDNRATLQEVRDFLRQKSITSAMIYANCSAEHIGEVQKKLPKI